MMARYTGADVNVIALIGERGREVNEFLENDLGPEGVKRSVVIVATSDQPATVRIRGAYLACAISEFFRDLGKDVLFMMDSATRLAMAAREIGLAAGEPPTAKGYTPSVFSLLPRAFRKIGQIRQGIHNRYLHCPGRGRRYGRPCRRHPPLHSGRPHRAGPDLAQKRHFPAIDVLRSVSRLTDRLLSAVTRNSFPALSAFWPTIRTAKT